jgi:hypothetical protein
LNFSVGQNLDGTAVLPHQTLFDKQLAVHEFSLELGQLTDIHDLKNYLLRAAETTFGKPPLERHLAAFGPGVPTTTTASGTGTFVAAS